ncbi:hypothetical protein SteCoe_19943 [Stentor coeruleus]|uniref:PAP-associated domain-containing protein n=1 Tax=Stentor coeruleus TaxID=5963 RepID=A0A1R2BSX0_9CILI|nr:hypothetical protein SteCoe_19943 [Stentor coeruleus]
MEIITECILMKESSEKSMEQLIKSQDPYAIGILLASPLSSTTISLLETLLAISSLESLPNHIQIGALAKFFRHFCEIHAVINISQSLPPVLSLLESSTKLLTKLLNIQENKEIHNFAIKSFSKTIERLCFELRTKLDVLKIVKLALPFQEIIVHPTELFKIPKNLFENLEKFMTTDIDSLIFTTDSLWNCVKNLSPSDFDPIKNVGFILIKEIFIRIPNNERNIKGVEELLLKHSEDFTKSQRDKLIPIYETFCRNFEWPQDMKITDALIGIKTEIIEMDSPWDYIDDNEDLMVIERETQKSLSYEHNSIDNLTEKTIDMLKKRFAREFVTYESIKQELDQITISNTANLRKMYDKILEIMNKDTESCSKFWRTMVTAMRKFRILGNDQLNIISNKINTLKSSRGHDDRPENPNESYNQRSDPRNDYKKEDSYDRRHDPYANDYRKDDSRYDRHQNYRKEDSRQEYWRSDDRRDEKKHENEYKKRDNEDDRYTKDSYQNDRRKYEEKQPRSGWDDWGQGSEDRFKKDNREDKEQGYGYAKRGGYDKKVFNDEGGREKKTSKEEFKQYDNRGNADPWGTVDNYPKSQIEIRDPIQHDPWGEFVDSDKPKKNPIKNSKDSWENPDNLKLIHYGQKKSDPKPQSSNKLMDTDLIIYKKPEISDPWADSPKNHLETNPTSSSMIIQSFDAHVPIQPKAKDILPIISPGKRLYHISELGEKISQSVDNNIPDNVFYQKLESALNFFTNKLKLQFPTADISLIGSLKYRLYLKNSPIDILVNDFSYPDRQTFKNLLFDYLLTQGQCSATHDYLLFSSKFTYHIYVNSKIPLHISQLIGRYNEALTINTFLYYIKIWSRDFSIKNISEKSYMWTILALFYLMSTNPPVIKNLQLPEIHNPVPVEGYDIFIDPGHYESLKTPAEALFIGFIEFLHNSKNQVFIVRTGEITKDDEFVLAVTDFFTDKTIGITKEHEGELMKMIQVTYEEISNIVKL